MCLHVCTAIRCNPCIELASVSIITVTAMTVKAAFSQMTLMGLLWKLKNPYNISFIHFPFTKINGCQLGWISYKSTHIFYTVGDNWLSCNPTVSIIIVIILSASWRVSLVSVYKHFCLSSRLLHGFSCIYEVNTFFFKAREIPLL